MGRILWCGAGAVESCSTRPEDMKHPQIDVMIERKKEVTENVVGTGEGWLTELSTAELKELFALRKDAVAR